MSIVRKILTRLCGQRLRQLIQVFLWALFHRDELSWSCFKRTLLIYCFSARRVGLGDFFGIIAPELDEKGNVIIGQGRARRFFFEYRPYDMGIFSMEVDDILAEYILERDLTDYYNVLGTEGAYEKGPVGLRAGDIVVDAGANMGIFSVLAAAKKVHRVYAFEPLKSICEILRRNVSLNNFDNTVVVVPSGLSDTTSTQPLYQSQDNIGGSSLVFDQTGNSVPILCTTLDQWVNENRVPRVDFIKADIEGAERQLLVGARETIRRFKPRLAICTYHLPDDPQVLEQLIRDTCSDYRFIHSSKKLYAWTE